MAATGSFLHFWRPAGELTTKRSFTFLTQRLQWNIQAASSQDNTVERHLHDTRIQNHHQRQVVRYRSNRSRRGLFDGRDIRSGNNVPFSMKKTKRKFRPNVFQKRVYSEILDEMVRFTLTTSALRSIDKAGGLDHYLLSSRHVIVDEGQGGAVKRRIIRELADRAKKERNGVEHAGTLPLPTDNAEEDDHKKLDDSEE